MRVVSDECLGLNSDARRPTLDQISCVGGGSIRESGIATKATSHLLSAHHNIAIQYRHSIREEIASRATRHSFFNFSPSSSTSGRRQTAKATDPAFSIVCAASSDCLATDYMYFVTGALVSAGGPVCMAICSTECPIECPVSHLFGFAPPLTTKCDTFHILFSSLALANASDGF